MKNKIFGIALIAMSLVSVNAVAQTPSNDNTPKQENIQMKKADKKARCPRFNPYEGMNLTDAQKTKLAKLDETRKAARAEKMQARQEKKEMLKVEKQRNDSLRMVERRAEKKSYLENVKSIVSPEQYVVFLENYYMNGTEFHKAKADFSKKKDMKKGRKDKADRRKDRKDKRGHQAYKRDAKISAEPARSNS